MSKEKILILSVGGSEEPLIFSIKDSNPDYVYFLHTPDSLKTCSKVLNGTGFDENNVEYIEIPNHESLDEAFIKSKELFSNLHNFEDYDVEVDFTGGTKTMVSGIVLAVIEGNYSNFRLSYVGTKEHGTRDKDGVGRVLDGSELIKEQLNPFEKYAISNFKRGKNFFNAYQFEAALENFRMAINRLDKTNELRRLAEIYEKIVLFYQKWDLFEDKMSKTINLYINSNILIENIESNEFIYNEFKDSNFLIQLHNNKEFLSFKLRGVAHDKNDPAIKNHLKFRISYYLSDLLNNSYRRIEEGKYDDAVARLYRINELIAQVQLTKIGIIDDDQLQTQKAFKININDLESKAKSVGKSNEINDFIEENASYYDKKKGYFPIANDKSFELLQLLGIKQSDKFDKLNSNLKVRNNSILAHGLNPIGKKKALELYALVLRYAKEYFPDLEKEMELASFPKFDI